MKFGSDIDIDFADREKILSKIRHTTASIDKDTAHNTGIYVTAIPYDPITNRSSIDYKLAEDRGYIKLDFLNVNLYNQIQDESHLTALIGQEPNWQNLYVKEFCQQLIHVGNHFDTLVKMPEPIDDIKKLAMFLAVIRPSKRHLIGLNWKKVAETIWARPEKGYYFKQSHSIAYAHLVVVHMNLLDRSTN